MRGDAMRAGLPWIHVPRLTVRKLVELWAGGVLLVWGILLVGWLVAWTRLSELNQQTLHDVRALDLARRLQLTILLDRREDLLLRLTGEDRYHQREERYEKEIGQIAAALDAYTTSMPSRQALAQIRAGLQELQVTPGPPPSLEGLATSADALLASVDQFYEHSESQTKRSMGAARAMYGTMNDWALGLSVGTAVLLLLGSVSTIRHVVRPVLALSRVAVQFGGGDFFARAPVLHEDELGELARTFNNMAEDIAHREKERLQFVAMVVHDLKNPVLAIEMAARLLRRPPESEEAFRSYLDALNEEARRLESIVRDLTDDLQVASGHFTLQKAPVDLCALVRQLLRAQAAALAAHQVDIESGERCMVWGDARRLERAAMNLVSNAVKYSPAGTRVVVRVEKSGAFVRLSVSDQGPGISREDLQVIFQPFGRGRRTDTLATGTGMGLYIVKQIVDAHSGRIEVESEPGHGATFRVILPLAQTGP
jgi:signal transduction histidine kinase